MTTLRNLLGKLGLRLILGVILAIPFAAVVMLSASAMLKSGTTGPAILHMLEATPLLGAMLSEWLGLPKVADTDNIAY